MTEFDIPSPFEGTWTVAEATLPNGDFAYTGTVTIQRTVTIFMLDWDITAGKYAGLGLPLAGHLFVSCGEQLAGLGLALYQLQREANVSIQWCTVGMSGAVGSGVFTTPWPGTFEGSHQIVQYLPNGQLYGEWSLSIQKTDQIYELTWRKGDVIHFTGLGLDTPNGLAAACYPDVKQLALLDYLPDPHDPRHLTAVWTLGGYTALGTETLTRS
jgi:hypothetical protein